MLTLEWPWLLALLPLPWLLRRWLPAQPQAMQDAMRVPFLDDFGGGETYTLVVNDKRRLWLAIAAWIGLLLACARPQWLGDPLELAVSGRDLMLAVDVSDSMRQSDFVIQNQRVDRLTATKYVAGDFISRRVGDRLGLILFGTTAYLHVPLTFDRKTLQTLLDEAFIGITDDEPATAIGDAIGLAIKRLSEDQSANKVLVLLTDGTNTAGELTPMQAAELAAQAQLKIYTIGIGADEMLVRNFWGTQRVNPSADMDEKTLKAIADKTGGRYFRARDTEELQQIYAILDQLEPAEKDKQYFRPKSELFYLPLALALLICGGLALQELRWR